MVTLILTFLGSWERFYTALDTPGADDERATAHDEVIPAFIALTHGAMDHAGQDLTPDEAEQLRAAYHDFMGRLKARARDPLPHARDRRPDVTATPLGTVGANGAGGGSPGEAGKSAAGGQPPAATPAPPHPPRRPRKAAPPPDRGRPAPGHPSPPQAADPADRGQAMNRGQKAYRAEQTAEKAAIWAAELEKVEEEFKTFKAAATKPVPKAKAKGAALRLIRESKLHEVGDKSIARRATEIRNELTR